MRKVLLAAMLLVVAAFAGCAQEEQPATPTPQPGTGGGYVDKGGDVSTQLVDQVNQLPVQQLSVEERSGILYMREEEKLARDVYQALYDKWGLRIFENIARSEQTHMDAVKALIDKYGLEDPAKDGYGEFTNPEFQKLYDELVKTGEKSEVDALKVGALIEEIDIVDLKERLSQTDNEDVKLVYENLMKGSRNHLRAFVSNLEKYGEEYEPHYLSKEEFEQIISTPMETGH
ncbi:MAG: DUF2202 domain-containing protein [Archaeoglobi archaeon]|nr:DUF2202 domain-containing protein [Archaeoglobi archaeon]